MGKLRPHCLFYFGVNLPIHEMKIKRLFHVWQILDFTYWVITGGNVRNIALKGTVTWTIVWRVIYSNYLEQPILEDKKTISYLKVGF